MFNININPTLENSSEDILSGYFNTIVSHLVAKGNYVDFIIKDSEFTQKYLEKIIKTEIEFDGEKFKFGLMKPKLEGTQLYFIIY